MEASKNPEAYPDLIVRVTGFTAYFANLSPDFRKLVLERIG
ncbi:MAG TPA: glycine radical domain-containing protein [Kiritimatiellia bacterium]|nr:glycine radical domain-containing protein [Kiritimatiellia bacterium]